MAFFVKWLFLIGLSAVGAVVVTASSSLAAGRNPLAALALFIQQPGSLIVFFLAWGAWMGLINDFAASNNVSRIFGHRVEFREVVMYGDLDDRRITPLNRKIYFFYPGAIVFAFVVLTSMIHRT